MQNSMIDFILTTNCGMYEKIKFGERHKRVSKEEYKIYEELKHKLPEEFKEEFETFVDLLIEEQAEAQTEFFRAGMKAGVRLAVECLTD